MCVEPVPADPDADALPAMEISQPPPVESTSRPPEPLATFTPAGTSSFGTGAPHKGTQVGSDLLAVVQTVPGWKELRLLIEGGRLRALPASDADSDPHRQLVNARNLLCDELMASVAATTPPHERDACERSIGQLVDIHVEEWHRANELPMKIGQFKDLRGGLLAYRGKPATDIDKAVAAHELRMAQQAPASALAARHEFRIIGPLMGSAVPALAAAVIQLQRHAGPMPSRPIHRDVEAFRASLAALIDTPAHERAGHATIGAMAARVLTDAGLSLPMSLAALELVDVLMAQRPHDAQEAMATDMAVATLISRLHPDAMADRVFTHSHLEPVFRGAQLMLAWLVRASVDVDLEHLPLEARLAAARGFMRSEPGASFGRQFAEPLQRMQLDAERLERLALLPAHTVEIAGLTLPQLLDKYVPPGSVRLEPIQWFGKHAMQPTEVQAGLPVDLPADMPAPEPTAVIAPPLDTVAADVSVVVMTTGQELKGAREAHPVMVHMPRPRNALVPEVGRKAPGNVANPSAHFHPRESGGLRKSEVKQREETNAARSAGVVGRFESFTPALRAQLRAERAARQGLNGADELAQGQRLIQQVFDMAPPRPRKA
ncbi:MAG: hypothetical protein EOO28_17515 [Comamonadaceae bacterium]|nr:MAG: hypothetical protein EOO28_17515 [Comamonadaceae bacterium]